MLTSLFTERFKCQKTKGKNKNKLLLSYLPNKSVLLIKLKDFNFIDLFNDLILSIHSKIKSIPNSESASEEFITTFHKWSDFFEDLYSNKLNENQIQGLFGELFVLGEYVKQTDSSNIDKILCSWKGLYDKATDFEFDIKNVEVKTKKEDKPFVKISSEFQLEQEFDKGLELIVISVVFDLNDGKSIYDLIKVIIQQTRIKEGDLGIIYHALSQKGLTVDSTKEYNNYRFIVKNEKIYDCTLNGFPKLSISNIPKEISSLKYNFRINTLSDFFLIEEKIY